MEGLHLTYMSENQPSSHFQICHFNDAYDHVIILEVTRDCSRNMDRRFGFREATYVYCCLSLLIGADVNAGMKLSM